MLSVVRKIYYNLSIVNTLETLKPAFAQDNCAVMMSVDRRYLPYLAVTLRSLLEYADARRNYDFIILGEELSALERASVTMLANGRANVSVRFLDASMLPVDTAAYPAHPHLSKMTYFRLFAPVLFPDYNRMVYLDSDLVVLADIAELCATDLGDCWLGACLDFPVMRMTALDAGLRQYFADSFDLADFSRYFNGGVLLLNLAELRRHRVEEQCRRLAAKSGLLRFCDQDLLNAVCRGRVCYLDSAWNVSALAYSWELEKHIPTELLGEYLAAKRNPRILHYVGRTKTGHNESGYPLADVFWLNAGKTTLGPLLANRRLEETRTELQALIETKIKPIEESAKTVKQQQRQLEKTLGQELSSLRHQQRELVLTVQSLQTANRSLEQRQRQLEKALPLMVTDVHNLAHHRQRYWFYAILSRLSWGCAREKYRRKLTVSQQKLKVINAWLKHS